MTARAPLARLALAGWLAAAGGLAGCSHGTSGDPSGPGVPPAAFTTTTPAPGLPGGTAPTAGSTAGGQPPVGTSGRPQPSGGTRPPAPGGGGGSRGGPPADLPRMPALVGRNLQDAEDRLHAAGVPFYPTTHDASGRKRPLTLAFFWKVCSQTPRPGQPVAKGLVPEVGVVKVEEQCP